MRGDYHMLGGVDVNINRNMAISEVEGQKFSFSCTQ